MRSTEKGMQMPEDICFKRDKETERRIRHLRQLEVYFRLMRQPGGSTMTLCSNYLKILN